MPLEATRRPRLSPLFLFLPSHSPPLIYPPGTFRSVDRRKRRRVRVRHLAKHYFAGAVTAECLAVSRPVRRAWGATCLRCSQPSPRLTARSRDVHRGKGGTRGETALEGEDALDGASGPPPPPLPPRIPHGGGAPPPTPPPPPPPSFLRPASWRRLTRAVTRPSSSFARPLPFIFFCPLHPIPPPRLCYSPGLSGLPRGVHQGRLPGLLKSVACWLLPSLQGRLSGLRSPTEPKR